MTEDTALLTAIAAGDQQAMAEFYRRHSSLVYRFATKTLHNGADAAEVMNEVMLEVWRKAGSFAGRSRVTTWLLGITHHKAVDSVRRKARHDSQELEEDSETSLHCHVDLDEVVAGARNARHVRRCLDELKSGHRQVVYLTFFEGMPYPEIATVLDIPAGTVKTRMMHAKKLLQGCLGRLVPGAPVL